MQELEKIIASKVLACHEPITEQALMKHVESKGCFDHIPSVPSSLALFQKHFLLMYSLYTLQNQFVMEEIGFLDVGPTCIFLRSWSDIATKNVTQKVESNALREYYLDINNLVKESNDSVNEMLNGFWQSFSRSRIVDQQQVNHALTLLNVTLPLNMQVLRSCYRKRIQKAHPDRGGTESEFIELKEAYEILCEYGRFK